MRAAMCFSHIQLHRYQVHTFSGSWWEKVHNFSRRGESSPNFRLLSPRICGLEGGHSRRWSEKSVSTNTEGNNRKSRNTNTGQHITDVASLTNGNINTSRVEISECKSIHIEQKISENKDISKPLTFIVFDIETTGFHRQKDRVIEIAMRDLSGGVNSTFQTLVNPGMNIENEEIHGISDDMVKERDVPRMNDLIPILLQYIQSRQKPGGQIVLIAHNAKTFDVPFMISEFKRCSYEFPSHWKFIDSMRLTREIRKAEGSKLEANSLKALQELYKIHVAGKAHRAMVDVDVLTLAFQRMTYDLKLTVSSLVENYTFTASELSNPSNKKKKISKYHVKSSK